MVGADVLLQSHSQAPLLLTVKGPWKGLWVIGGGSINLDSHNSEGRSYSGQDVLEN